MRQMRTKWLSLSLIQVNKSVVVAAAAGVSVVAVGGAVVVVRLKFVHKQHAKREVVPLIGLPDWSVRRAIMARVVFLSWNGVCFAADQRPTTQAAAVTAMIRLRSGARSNGDGPKIEDYNRERRPQQQQQRQLPTPPN